MGSHSSTDGGNRYAVSWVELSLGPIASEWRHRLEDCPVQLASHS